MRWRKMAWAAKEELVRQCAKYLAQLFQKQFDKIGNIFPQTVSRESLEDGLSKGTENNDKVTIGRIVPVDFFLGDRVTKDVPRGPFNTSLEWMQTLLKLILEEQNRILATSDEDKKKTQNVL